MEWIWLAGAALTGFFVGVSLRGRVPQNSQAPMLNTLALNMASDKELMLATFRRELANYMVRLDPDRFLRDMAGYGGMAAGCDYAVLLQRFRV